MNEIGPVTFEGREEPAPRPSPFLDLIAAMISESAVKAHLDVQSQQWIASRRS